MEIRKTSDCFEDMKIYNPLIPNSNNNNNISIFGRVLNVNMKNLPCILLFEGYFL
jgi:hypothetical protein